MYHLLRLLTVIIVSCSFLTQDIAAQEKRTSTRKSTKASSTDQALATPFSPPSGPAQRLAQGPTPKVNS